MFRARPQLVKSHGSQLYLSAALFTGCSRQNLKTSKLFVGENLLVLLGNRIRELGVAKEWSQEEFAHVSGFHRTYVGQVERGEKNMSFENLVKIAAVLGVTPSELLSALDTGASGIQVKRPKRDRDAASKSVHQAHEVEKLLVKLKHQRTALDETLKKLEDLLSP